MKHSTEDAHSHPLNGLALGAGAPVYTPSRQPAHGCGTETTPPPEKRTAHIRLRSTLLAVAAVLPLGCATVTVRKVPTPTQYSKELWNAGNLQQQADAMEGVRFYLPRPFVSVFESFPVATDVYLVNGTVSADGKYVYVDSVRKGHPLLDVFASNLKGEEWSFEVPERYIERPTVTDATAARALDLQGLPINDAMKTKLAEAVTGATKAAAEAGGAASKAASDAQSAAESARKDANRADAAASQNPTGINKRGVSNDNGAYAYQPLRGNLDIVYMPDFDEQYVVSSQSGLGNAQFQVNLGQGWSLQGFNSETDNSQLTARIFDLIDTAVKAAKAAVGTLAGGPIGAALAGGLELQTRTLDKDAPGAELHKGTPVTLKIVIVHYAAKGLYPVLKPRELLEHPPAAVVIDAFDGRPQVRDIKAITDETIRRVVEAQYPNNGRYTVPVYPYQYISFNTFRYVAVEVVTNNGSPFGTLYDRTGTTGEAGGARVADPPTRVSPAPQDQKPEGGSIDQVQQSLDHQIKDLQQTDLNFMPGTFDVRKEDGDTTLVLTYRHQRPQATGTSPLTFTAKQRETAMKALESVKQKAVAAAKADIAKFTITYILPPSNEMLKEFQGIATTTARAGPGELTVSLAPDAQSYVYAATPAASKEEAERIQTEWTKYLGQNVVGKALGTGPGQWPEPYSLAPMGP
ncbi:MAG: hypothetical protein ACKVS8_11170 [Phycisphaerales bacterium]